MGTLVGLTVGLVLWIIGFGLFKSPHHNFDWFLPLPLLLLIGYAVDRLGPYVRERLKP